MHDTYSFVDSKIPPLFLLSCVICVQNELYSSALNLFRLAIIPNTYNEYSQEIDKTIRIYVPAVLMLLIFTE